MPTQTSRTSGVDHATALFPSAVLRAPFSPEPEQQIRRHGRQNNGQMAVQTLWAPMGRNSLSQHERDEVTLFGRRTVSAEHVVAVSSKPFFRFRLIGVALWICRRSHRLNVFARPGLPGLSCVCRMTRRAGWRVRLAG